MPPGAGGCVEPAEATVPATPAATAGKLDVGDNWPSAVASMANPLNVAAIAGNAERAPAAAAAGIVIAVGGEAVADIDGAEDAVAAGIAGSAVLAVLAAASCRGVLAAAALAAAAPAAGDTAPTDGDTAPATDIKSFVYFEFKSRGALFKVWRERAGPLLLLVRRLPRPVALRKHSLVAMSWQQLLHDWLYWLLQQRMYQQLQQPLHDWLHRLLHQRMYQ